MTSIKSVEGWGDERVLYNFKNGGFSKDTGHFTQMVWKDTYGVGCGAALCPGIISSGVKQWSVASSSSVFRFFRRIEGGLVADTGAKQVPGVQLYRGRQRGGRVPRKRPYPHIASASVMHA